MVKPLAPDRLFKVCTPGAQIDSPEFSDLLEAYGQAMWSWTRAENKLFIIFAFAFSGNEPDVKALRELFFSVISPQARIDMIHAIAKVRWKNSKVWHDWVKLYSELKTELGVRGRLAHLAGYSFHPPGKNKKAVAILMAPPWHPSAPVTHGQAKAYGFDAEKLSALAKKWQTLESRVGVFVSLVEHERDNPELLLSGMYLRHLLHGQDDQIHVKPSPQRPTSGE